MSYLEHYGTPRKSGRYPWGSGGTKVAKGERLLKQGLSELEVAKALGIPLEDWRNQKAIAKGEEKEAQRIFVTRQRESGMSVGAIAREIGAAPSTVRDLLAPYANEKFRIVKNTAETLRDAMKGSGFVDIGEGTEVFLGISRLKLKTAVQMLKNEGYKTMKLQQEQLGNPGKKTTILVLAEPGKTYKDLLNNKQNVAIANYYSEDGGRTFLKGGSAKDINASRVLVRYANEGGADKDGLIELRRGVPDLNIGNNRYAQVRIGVDGTHYLKGMAIMRDDIPAGFDVVYNVTKQPTGNKFDAFKSNEVGKISKFGSIVKPNTYLDKNGKEVNGVVNIIGEKTLAEEGSWAKWKRSLSAQVLSKQPPSLAKEQLDISIKNSEAELAEISSLTNPTLKKHLLIDYSDKMDKASYELKAAALPGLAYHVLLPDPDMKPGDIYAPNYNNGEKVALVRYPHGGIFEIPELTVNNKYSQYRKLIGADAPDAVAIHPSVANKLSGADFDGDTVLVIPNSKGKIKAAPSLKELKDFDPRGMYKIPKVALYDEKENPKGIKPMTERQKQRLMGEVTNLITDMTIKGASQNELSRAIKHSMVVIDAVKHDLNYKQSYQDQGIAALRKQYQGSAKGGADTLVSRAKSQYRVPARRDRYDIDPKTGEKKYLYTGETYINKKTGERIPLLTKSYKGAESRDGYTLDGKALSSGTYIESIYSDYANNMKRLANKARLESLKPDTTPYSKEARIAYKNEVNSLDAKYKEAIKSRPLERRAQILGEAIYKDKVDQNPGMGREDRQKEKGRAIAIARSRLGSKKATISITPREWEAIEMGSISNTRIKDILQQADMNQVRRYATPRTGNQPLSKAKMTRARALLNNDYTNKEVAAALGVSVSQIQEIKK